MKKLHHVHLNCSYCGRSQREVRKLVAGPTVYICDGCIRACVELISEHARKELTGDDSPGAPSIVIDESAKKAATPQRIAAWVRRLEAELREIPLARAFADRAGALALGIEAAATRTG